MTQSNYEQRHSPTSTSQPAMSTLQPPPFASSSRHRIDDEPSHTHLRQPSITYTDTSEQHDQVEELFDPFAADPSLRLRTVRTAHSVIAESIRSEAFQENRRKKRRLFQSMKRKASTMTTKRRHSEAVKSDDVSESGSNQRKSSVTIPTEPEKKDKGKEKEKGKAKPPEPRRDIHVNIPLPSSRLNPQGDPINRYVRNKVRTSKYTIITFLPKNLFEQFRRVANIYFLALVILQVFEIFGATNAQIGMLPLLAILGMTAIKDGIEDWRRSTLDDEVNNSATTKLGGWRNVNQPKDGRSWWEKMFGLGTAPGRASKGVRKLRMQEAATGKQIVMERQKAIDEEDMNVTKQSYPLETLSRTPSSENGESPYPNITRDMPRAPSMMSRKSTGVLDWSRPSSGNTQWERTLWKKLEVGDLVLLRDNEQVPADIIVLSTSNADALCFVETKNLDGETNLKVRKALKATSSINSEEDLEHAQFIIDTEPPHANLYTYNGVLRYTPSGGDKGGDEKQEAITINEMLLRGCTIRNTKWIIGMVLFTGGDTKIMLNGGDTPYVSLLLLALTLAHTFRFAVPNEVRSKKRLICVYSSSAFNVKLTVHSNVIMNFVILIFLCLVTALLHGWYRSMTGTSADYYEIDSEASENIYLDSVIIFASCLIVFQNIVPISLYITIEIVKTIQAYFIFQDIEMYYEPFDTPCVPKTWNISDDLGQIEYVFSDKTGTLTQNVMEFKKCSINGVTFGEGLTEAMMGAAKRDGRDLGPAMAIQDEQLAVSKAKMLDTMKSVIHNRYLREEQLTLVAPELPARLVDPNDPLRPHIIDFFRALAICHSVLADAPEPTQPFILDYKAESPDEAALVAAARDVGFPFVTKNNTRLEIEVLGKVEKWVPLRMLEFNSSRKRMSVIARDPQGRIVLFCKGADSVIYERLTKNHDQQLKAVTLKDLETFANGGLRTLCIARRYLSEEEFEDWSRRYDTACAAVTDRENEIERTAELVEHSLTILGATALEDKLQEGVPDAIAMLHRAGIKLWILTGDKLQTAIEIGYSCNLLTNDMEVMIISADSEDGARAQIEAGINKIASVLGPPTVKGRVGNGSNPSATFAVVIDGESLRYALQPGLKSLFLSLGTQCSAVICCRVSPSQKALTVRLVKEGCNAMTLSIGDGANDVAMIQEANVGVGLYGLEGAQAAMSADYAFGQFRFLTRLLLVHGRWSYVRIADMHANFFYKTIIWTLAMFWFLIFNSFDATYLFEYTFLLLYTLVFTSLPVGVMGAFEQDTNAAASMAFPALYKRGVQGLDYTRRRFWTYMGDGLYQSAIIFFIPFLAYGTAAPWSASGRDTAGLYDFGTTIACAGVISANVYVGINTRYWTWITVVVYAFSTIAIYIWIPVYSYLAALPFNGEVAILFSTFSFWAVTLITVFCAVGPRWLVSAFRQSYLPRDKDIIRESWVAGDLKEQLGIKHRRDRRRAEVEAEAVEMDRSASFADHLHQALDVADGDERGYYQAAAMASPQKEIGRSPLMSGSSTPRSPFSYPPPSPALGRDVDYSPTPRTKATVPPPLSLRTNSDPPLISPTPVGARDLQTQQQGRLGHTPVSPYSYTSPSALDTYTLASDEVKRLSKASVDLKRASLSPDSVRIYNGGSLNGKGRAGGSSTPQKRSSWPALGDMLGVPRQGASSPVRGSHEGVRGFSGDRSDDGHMTMDFSEATGWENGRRDTMMDVDLTDNNDYTNGSRFTNKGSNGATGGFAV